jgi:hypothetical protein
MPRLIALAIVLAAALTTAVRAEEADAKAIAQEVLNKGSALFDAKDVAGLLATYDDDPAVDWVEKDGTTGEVKQTVKRGKAEVESIYGDHFKNVAEKTTSKNIVEYARLIGPDMLLITGTFQPDVAKPGKYPFVQLRVKKGDKWLLKDLHLFTTSVD